MKETTAMTPARIAVLGIVANRYTPGVVERQVPRTGTWRRAGTMDGVRTPSLATVVDGLGHAGAISISNDIRASTWMKPPVRRSPQ